MPPKESLIAKAKENLSQVLSALHANPASKAHYLPLARQVVSQVDQSQIMSSPHRLIERKWFLQGLQQYATWGNTHGAYQEIAAWCETHWNGILHHDPQNAAALNGASFLVSIMVSGMHGADLPAALGSYWLYRAQPLLTRIYDAEAMVFGDVPTGSSAETLASGVRSRVMSAVTEDDTDSAIVEELRHRPDYVEARGLLSPAANFFSRAVNATPDTDPSYGHLLVEVRYFPRDLQSLSQRICLGRQAKHIVIWERLQRPTGRWVISSTPSNYCSKLHRYQDLLFQAICKSALSVIFHSALSLSWSLTAQMPRLMFSAVTYVNMDDIYK
jgi:hypothetical protein